MQRLQIAYTVSNDSFEIYLISRESSLHQDDRLILPVYGSLSLSSRCFLFFNFSNLMIIVFLSNINQYFFTQHNEGPSLHVKVSPLAFQSS